MPTALIVDHDMENLLSLSGIFRARGYSVETATDLRRARETLVRNMPEVALLNEQVDGESSFDMLEQVDLSDVVEIYLMSAGRSVASGQYVRVSVGTPLVEVERRHILSTHACFEGDKKKTANALGISLKTLYNRLNKYGTK